MAQKLKNINEAKIDVYVFVHRADYIVDQLDAGRYRYYLVRFPAEIDTETGILPPDLTAEERAFLEAQAGAIIIDSDDVMKVVYHPTDAGLMGEWRWLVAEIDRRRREYDC